MFFFRLLFYGGRMLAGQAITDSIEGTIVGYFLWTLSATSCLATWFSSTRHSEPDASVWLGEY